jgi:hypothetical protein
LARRRESSLARFAWRIEYTHDRDASTILRFTQDGGSLRITNGKPAGYNFAMNSLSFRSISGGISTSRAQHCRVALIVARYVSR